MAELPRFKDRTVYIKTAKGEEVSKSVCSSYKGILRISPNNYKTLLETGNDESFVGLNYIDKTDAYISDEVNNNFLQVSNSEGNMLDLKLASNKISSNNVYVLGAINCNNLILINKGNSNFTINKNTNLPITTNNSQQTEFDNSYDFKPIDHTNGDVNTDIEVDDNSAIVINTSNSKDKRIFGYKNARKIVRDIIFNNLASLQTVPTGSIHFIPITLEQYKQLAKLNDDTYSFSHNSYKMNDYETDTDPLIRDYLLCDGKKYYCRDFPELAKIINGEKISYDAKESDDSNNYVISEHINLAIKNDYEPNEERTFRVPDLRHKFIKSIWLSPDTINNNCSTTGIYSPDYMPEKFPEKNRQYEDRHFHFISSAIRSSSFKRCMIGDGQIWEPNYVQPYNGWKKQKIEDKEVVSNIKSATEGPSIMRLATDCYRGSDGGDYGSITTIGPSRGGFWHQPNYKKCGKLYNLPGIGSPAVYWVENGFNANCFFSQPIDAVNADGKCKYKANIIASSWDFNNDYNPKNIDTNIYNKDNEEYMNMESNSDNKENIPEYVACLPFIKI